MACVVLGVVALSAQYLDESGAASAMPACSGAAPLLIEPQTEGTAGQAYAFVSVFNAGTACGVDGVGALTVVQAGHTVRSVLGNPGRVTVRGIIPHGVTIVFDGVWSNWCGNRHAFRVTATFGSGTATGPYHVLPDCIVNTKPSRLQMQSDLVHPITITPP